MKKPIIRTGANGRRSTCVAHNGILYTAGITSSQLDGDMTRQAKDVFAQLDKLMQYSGTDKSRLLSASILLKDIHRDYADFNAVWDAWIAPGEEPARSVSQAELPLEEYLLKVSLIVAIPE